MNVSSDIYPSPLPYTSLVSRKPNLGLEPLELRTKKNLLEVVGVKCFSMVIKVKQYGCYTPSYFGRLV